MLVNHLGLFLIGEIDAEARTADVTRLRSNVQLKGIPWSIIRYCDEGFRRVPEVIFCADEKHS